MSILGEKQFRISTIHVHQVGKTVHLIVDLKDMYEAMMFADKALFELRRKGLAIGGVDACRVFDGSSSE